MAPITLYDSDMAILWYNPEKKVVHHQIKKFIYGEEFKKLLLTGTDAMKKYQAKKWLSDDRTNSVMRPEDMEWGQTNWFPQTVQAGWKYWAIVQPAKAIAQMNMEELVKIYSQAGVVAKFFSDPEEAMKWLDTCG
jgi:hypothetical protein